MPYSNSLGDIAYTQRLLDNARRAQAYSKPGPYITQLDSNQEAAFRAWAASERTRELSSPSHGGPLVEFNPSDKISDYDMRGYWNSLQHGGQPGSGVNPTDGSLHLTDEFKTPYHKSFSAESRYAGPGAPSWVNDYQLVMPDRKTVVDDEVMDHIRAVLSGRSGGSQDRLPGERWPVTAGEIKNYLNTGIGR